MEGAKEKRRGGNSEREGREGEKAEKGRATTERDREEREGKGRDQRPPTEQSTLSEASESLRRQKEDRKREKERKKAEKKAKKKSKHSLQGAAPGSSSKQRERVGGGEAHRAGSKELEAILLSVFQPYDPDGSGYVDSTVFWQVIQSSELNLQFSAQELSSLQEVVPADRSGLIPYAEFATHATDIIASLYQDQPPSDTHWLDMTTPSGGRVVSYNKQTGESRDLVEEGVDLFADTIQDLFQKTDIAGKGYATREEFIALLQSEEMASSLTETDLHEMLQYFDAIPEGQADYLSFYPLAKELILRVYRMRDQSDSEWCQLSSQRFGLFYFNKYTGETRRGTSTTEQPDVDLLTQAYNQVEEINFQLEQYKQENRELQNQLAQGREEQEVLATQLDETGHILDEANTEIRRKEGEAAELRAVAAAKEQEMEQLRTELAEIEGLKGTLQQMEQQLQDTQGMVAARDQGMVDRESNISTLQRQSQSIVEKLKTAQGTIDARDSAIAKLQHQLRTEQKKLCSYEEQTPALESRVAELEEESKRTAQSLEEKTSVLSTTRKHLKQARELNMELERETERAGQAQDKLRRAESEIRTLKTFLTSKTALVERRKKELMEARVKLAELEERDSRRAIILADVLEKTARQYKQEIRGRRTEGGTGHYQMGRQDGMHYLGDSLEESSGGRPVSAPPLPLGPPIVFSPSSSSPPPHHTLTPHRHSPGHLKSYMAGRPVAPGGYSIAGRGRRGRREVNEMRTVPKLPPIHRRPQQKSSFQVPTVKELKRRQKVEDKKTADHSALNPNCTCTLCRHSGGAVGPGLEGGEGSLTNQAALEGLLPTQESSLAKQLCPGQRVLVRMKASEYDLEPQKCTGIVKYVGKIDSEFIDNRIYVGVKLDEPVGDTDGLVKGKRYFTCLPKHGKVVRLSSILAVLPNKSMAYRPLQITKRSPYTTATPRHMKVT